MIIDLLGQNADWIGAVAAAVGALVTVLMVIATYRVATVTRLAVQSQILLEMTRRYADPEILNGMKSLRAWQNRYPDHFASEFVQRRDNPHDDAYKLDEQRRLLAHYFWNALTLLDAGVLNKKALLRLISREQVDFLIEVLEPIERRLPGPPSRPDAFDRYGKLYGREPGVRSISH